MSSAIDRLAQTRRAIVMQLHGPERGRDSLEPDDAARPAGPSADQPRSGQRGWWTRLERAARMWWRQHPAHTGLEAVKPVLSAYAAQKPVQFLAVAAAAGALFAVARGWRLVSIAGVVAALIKASPPSGFVLAALATADVEEEDQGPAGR